MGFLFNVTKTIYDSSGDLEIEYALKDESFSHAFGTQKHVGYEVVKVQIWAPIMDRWVDMTLDYKCIEDLVNRLIEKDMSY